MLAFLSLSPEETHLDGKSLFRYRNCFIGIPDRFLVADMHGQDSQCFGHLKKEWRQSLMNELHFRNNRVA